MNADQLDSEANRIASDAETEAENLRARASEARSAQADQDDAERRVADAQADAEDAERRRLNAEG